MTCKAKEKCDAYTGDKKKSNKLDFKGAQIVNLEDKALNSYKKHGLLN